MLKKELIKVSVIEDNKVLNDILCTYIEESEFCELLSSFLDFESAFDEIHFKKPDIILMDINLPGINGINGTRKIIDAFPSINIIIVTALEDSDNVFKSLSAGATGYLTKTFSPQELIESIIDCSKGGAPMSAKIAKMVVTSFKKSNNSPLTEREKEVLDYLSMGYSYSSIADELFLSKATIKFHIKNIYFKLQVKSKNEALKEARKNRYI